MKRMFALCSIATVLVFTLLGCSSSETKEQKIEGFKHAHGAIYDAWQAVTETELEDRLQKGLANPFLKEQIEQQSKVMKARVAQNERHIVNSITYNKLEMVKEGSDECTLDADWSVLGTREHGDVHEMKVSYHKKFHMIKKDGVWKIDQMLPDK